MPRNMTGGSGHKRAKRGEKSGGLKAKAAALELLDVLIEREQLGLEKLALTKGGNEKIEALKVLQVGRIVKRLGNGWMDVFCQDNKERRCLIRGLLRSKKSGAFMEIDSFVVVALEKPLDDLDDSDDEGNYAGGGAGGSSKGYIVGLFDEHAIGRLQKTTINKRLFQTAMGGGVVMEDIFDRSTEESAAVEEESAAGARAKERRSKKAAGGGGDVDIDNL